MMTSTPTHTPTRRRRARRRMATIAAAAGAVLLTACQPGFTYVWAGSGQTGDQATTYQDNNKYAVDLGGVRGITSDSAGNLYFADASLSQILRLSTDGTVTTIAGHDGCGTPIEGAPAVDSKICTPVGLAFAPDGSLTFADLGSGAVRQIGTDGNIHTIAGNGTSEYTGDGSLATETGLSIPIDLVYDVTGNLYVAAAGNNRVLRIDTDGIVTTVAGNGIDPNDPSAPPIENDIQATDATLNWPNGLTWGPDGDLYFSDSNNNQVRKVDLSTGIISLVAGNSQGLQGFGGDGLSATSAYLCLPYGLSFDQTGNLYIADDCNNRIRRVDIWGSIATVAGTGDPDPDSDSTPIGSALDLAISPSVLWSTPAGALLAPSGDVVYRIESIANAPVSIVSLPI